MYLVYNTVVRCVSFFVVAGNCSQIENTFLQKILLGCFLWFASRCVFFIRPNTLLLCISLFCIFLLYHTDPQVEVQIRILLRDKYRKSCQKCEHGQSHFDFLKNDYSVSLFLKKQLTSQNIFLVKSELSITTYLFLVFYKSTSLQTQLFLKNIDTFLCK
jgi:hypothetical protein